MSSAMLYIEHNKAMQPMDQAWQNAVLNAVPGTAAMSSLFVAPITDHFGRKKVILCAIICDAIGGLLCSLSLNKIMLLIGRVIIGLALGLGSTVVPIYIGEISPPNCRGILITSFQLLITCGFASANIIAGGLSYLQPIVIGWRLMLGFTIVPAVLEFIVLSFMPDSPRWLCANDQQEEGVRVMQWLHCNNEKLQQKELDRLGIYIGYKARLNEMLEGGWRITHLSKDIHVLQQLLVGCSLQIFQQLSAINAVFYYSSTIIKAAGVKRIRFIIWLSCLIMIVNFLATMVPMLTIERLGRRRLLLGSVAGAAVALVFTGVSFGFINRDSVLTLPLDQTFQGNILNSVPYFKRCAQFKNCDSCVNDERCGFCTPKLSTSSGSPKSSTIYGYCLPIDQNVTLDESKSSIGPCFYVDSSFDWEDNYCTSQYTSLLVLSLTTFVIFFSCGYAPLTWVINAEIYPIWARSTCAGIAASSAFFIYASITLVAFLFFYIFMPETKGTSLEDLEATAKVNQKPVTLVSLSMHSNSLFLSQEDGQIMERF